MKTNRWEDNLKEGVKGETALKNRLHDILFSESIKQITWDEKNLFSMNLQRHGVDGTVNLREITWESKIRNAFAHKFKDMLIETVSVMETNKPGWFYYSIADFVIYSWMDITKTSIIDGYFIFIQNPELKNWFEENKNNYQPKIAESSNKQGRIWHTKNIPIPIKDFPKGTILKFNPNISLDEQQLRINTFLMMEEPKKTTKQVALYHGGGK